ncbi:MAG: helix-turn-helix domain-containing protein [Candidatus Limnocylindria bacterium]
MPPQTRLRVEERSDQEQADQRRRHAGDGEEVSVGDLTHLPILWHRRYRHTAAAGLDNDVIAARLNTRREVVSKWRRRFFEEGLAGLDERPRRSRPARISPWGSKTPIRDQHGGFNRWPQRALRRRRRGRPRAITCMYL